MASIQSQSEVKGSAVEQLELLSRSFVTRFKNYRLYVKTISELNALTSRELVDLGLSRSMIKRVAYAAVYQSRDYRRDTI